MICGYVFDGQGIIKHHSLEHGNTFECVRADGSVDLSCMDGRILNPLRFLAKKKSQKTKCIMRNKMYNEKQNV